MLKTDNWEKRNVKILLNRQPLFIRRVSLLPVSGFLFQHVALRHTTQSEH
jgi:hypothetical protein